VTSLLLLRVLVLGLMPPYSTFVRNRRHRHHRDHKHFTVSEVAVYWHELMITQHVMRLFIACINEQLEPRCSM